MGFSGKRIIYTIGHSTLSASRIAQVMESLGSTVLVDVRRWASSLRNPEASRQVLESEMRARGLGYVHIPALGGYRTFGRDVPEALSTEFACYQARGFNAYAAYLATNPQAWRSLELIVYLAIQGAKPTVMCSERLPWRCHRKVIAEWLSYRGFKVIHYVDGKLVEHRPGRCRALAH
ncbi:MAG: DUF488 family protein [Desulfurococcales archaeon]|nr:DUF488 family protein [Desulfurococcales archaeon]